MLLAEQLVDQARTRRTERMAPRERIVLGLSAACFLAVATALAVLLPNERNVDYLLVGCLLLGYAFISLVRFEFGGSFGTAEQLLLVPIFALAPLPFVALLIGLSQLVGTVPDVIKGRWHRQRLVGPLADSWFCIPPVLVLAQFSPGLPDLGDAQFYALAFVAQAGGDLGWSVLRGRLLDDLPTRELVSECIGTLRLDAIFLPLAFLITVAAVDEPWRPAERGPLHLAPSQLRPRPRGALGQRGGAPSRLSRNGDAPLRRRGVRGQLHGRAFPLRRRAGERRGGRAERARAEQARARVRGHAPRRGQDRHPQGDPQQAEQPRRPGVRGHEDPHDRGPVPARPCGRPARPGRRDRALLPRALGRARVPRRPGGRPDPVRLADRVLLRRLQRHDERPRLPQGAPHGGGAARAARQRGLPVRSEDRAGPDPGGARRQPGVPGHGRGAPGSRGHAARPATTASRQ